MRNYLTGDNKCMTAWTWMKLEQVFFKITQINYLSTHLNIYIYSNYFNDVILPCDEHVEERRIDQNIETLEHKIHNNLP